MAGQTINMNLNVQTNLNQANQQAQQLNQNLTAAQRTANSIRIPAQGRSASQTAAYSSASAATSGGSSGLGRGATGVGGGVDSKDFARQAQGLGGLVHVYATFAANIFAVSAAFTALKKAADYTNMVDGLNQLGAASGKNLGTMAKNMVSLTDGALSLKESMEAVAQASSAGMSGTQIERMSLVAKKASQALGRDMSDSISRLSRGITKMEPELLDELGIFTRVDKAAQNYALSIGKTANNLTDFEKRQAFANAALKEAENKFGKIELDANPYSKLQASVVDLLYSGGELLNKVLGPVAKILAASPSALGLAMLSIVGILVKQAIPALTQWRQNLAETAKTSAAVAKELAASQQLYNINKQNANLEATLAPLKEAQNNAIANVQTALAKALPATSKLVKRAMSDGFIPDEKDIKNYTTAITNAEKKVAGTQAVINTAPDLGVVAAAEKRLKLEQESLNNLKQAKLEAIQIKDIADQRNKLEEQHLKTSEKARWWTMEAARDRIAENAAKKSTKYELLSDFSKNTQSMGMLGALERLDIDMKERLKNNDKTLTKFGSGIIKIQAGIMGFVSSVGTMLASIGNFFAYIGIAVVLFQTLDMLFSKNAKQAEAFSSSIDTAKESVEGFTRTSKLYADKEYFTSENVVAYANAINSISDASGKLLDTFKELKESDNWWSNLKNGISRAWGGNDEAKLAKGLASQVTSILKTSEGKQQAYALKDILGTDNLSNSGIEKAINTLAENKDYAGLNKLKELLRATGTDAANTASKLQGFNTTMDAAVKTQQEFAKSMIPGDTWSKLGMVQIDASNNFTKALESPINAVTSLKELIEDTSKLSILPEGTAKGLLALAPEITKVNRELKQSEEGIKAYQDAINKAKVDAKYYNGIRGEASGKTDLAKGLDQGLKEMEALNKSAILGAEKLQEKGLQVAADMYTAGSEKLGKALKAAIVEGANAAQKALISGLSGVGVASINTDLQKQSIAAQMESIKAQRELILSTERLALIYEKAQLENKVNTGTAAEQATARFSLDNVVNPSLSLLDGLKGGAKSLPGALKGAAPGAVARLSGASSSVIGSEAQLAKLGGEMQAVTHQGKLKEISEEYAAKQKILKTEKESNDERLKSIDLSTSDKNIFNDTLEAEREKLLARQDSLLLAEKENSYLESAAKWNYAISNTKNQRDKERLSKDAAAELSALASSVGTQKDTSIRSTRERELGRIDKESTARQSQFEIENKRADIISNTVSALEEAGKITAIQAIREKASLETRKAAQGIEEQIATLREKSKNATEEEKAQYDVGIARLTTMLDLDKERIRLQANYQEALVKAEDTMRSMEKGDRSGNFLGALAEDFGNKLTQMTKAAKSAGDTFNQGLITAIDSTIDKFFEAMQKGELTLKGMLDFARSALSDVFRDTASQLMKNSWKDLLKGVLPETDADKALGEMKTQSDYLKQIALNTSKTSTTGGVLSTVDPTEAGDGGLFVNKLVQSSEKQDATAGKNTKTADTFGNVVGDFGKGIKDWVSGNGSILSVFGSTISRFGSLALSLVTSLFSATSGGSGGGGILGSLLGGFGGLFGEGGFSGAFNSLIGADVGVGEYIGGALRLAAKGGVFNSPSLSAHSGTIVSSPTMFAFAKGAGLMGEAGPEAILPLKRDGQGNLGIRGGGTGEVNISIVINAETGESKTQGNSSSQNMNQLASNISGMVKEELIKQKRPGGLLYA